MLRLVVKSLAGYEAVLPAHKPFHISVEGHHTVAWNWVSSFSRPLNERPRFSRSPARGDVQGMALYTFFDPPHACRPCERDRTHSCPSRKDDMQQIITAKLKLITTSDQCAALRTTQLASA